MPANAFAQILRATPEIKLFTQRRSRWCTTGCLHINRLTARHGGSQHTLVQFSFVCSTSKVAIKPLAPSRRPSSVGARTKGARVGQQASSSPQQDAQQWSPPLRTVRLWRPDRFRTETRTLSSWALRACCGDWFMCASVGVCFVVHLRQR